MGRSRVKRTRIWRWTRVARGVAKEAAGDGRSRVEVGGLWEETWVEGLCKRGVGGMEREKRERLLVVAGIGEGLEKHLVLLKDGLLER